MASKLHRRTLQLLKKILGCAIKEEVNVQQLFKDYPTRDHHFDLVIPSYNLVVECHGEQHRSLQTFGEKDSEIAVQKLHQQQHRDRRKEEIVWENCWGYIAIWHDELPKDNDEAVKVLKKKILEAIKRIDDE